MNLLFPYAETTRSVTIRVAPSFLPEQSNPEEATFVWAYHVRVENGGGVAVQLLSRTWIISDGLGQTQEVSGPGVIGQQPTILPGESYDYVSGCPLSTPSGMMRGTYEMVDASGERFAVVIPCFSLDSPFARSSLH